MQRRRPRQHPRRLNSGKKVMVNKGITNPSVEDIAHQRFKKLWRQSIDDMGTGRYSERMNWIANQMNTDVETVTQLYRDFLALGPGAMSSDRKSELLYGPWQYTNIDAMSADEWRIAAERAGKDVKKPTAYEVSPDKKRWRIYYKPIYPGEFWD